MKPVTPPRHWAQINEVGFLAGLRMMYWIGRIFGRGAFRIVVYPLVAWYILTKTDARRASREYLWRIHAIQTPNQPAPDWRDVLRHFMAFADCILDKALIWGGIAPGGPTRLYGRDILAGPIARREGGVILCAHFGNLELCRQMSRTHPGLRLTVLVHTKNARSFNRLLAQLDPDSQLDLMQVTEMTPATAMLLNEKVSQGGFVVIAADRIPVSRQPRIVMANFLGAPAPFPVGAYILASLFRCPVYLMFSMRVDQATEVHLELFRDSIRLHRANRDAELAQLVQEYALRLESYCLRVPLQWFNFYAFWQLPDMSKFVNESDASQ